MLPQQRKESAVGTKYPPPPTPMVNKVKKDLKVRLSPSKKIRVICFIESPLKMMKNTFYFILKVIFVLKIFQFFLMTFWSC